MRFAHVISIFTKIAFCSSSAAVAQEARPAWVDSGESPEVSKSLFIVGIGAGDSISVAQADALGSISKQIRSDVVSKTVATLSSTNDSEGDSSSLDKSTKVASSGVLNHVKFAKQHYDGSTYFVLAALKISDYARNLAAAATEQVGSLKNRQRAISAAGLKASAFRDALEFKMGLRRLGSSMTELDSLVNAHPGLTTEDFTSLRRGYLELKDAEISIQNSLAKFPFTYTPAEKHSDDFAARVSVELIRIGARKADKPEAAKIRLNVASKVQSRPSMTGKLRFVNVSFDVELKDTTGEVFWKKSYKGEGGGIDEDSAIAKAGDDILERVTKDIVSASE